MTDESNSISRRNVLAGLATVGVGGALAGAGTSAYFSDGEGLDNEMIAGELSLVVDWQEWYKGGETVGPGYQPIDAFPDTNGDGTLDLDYYNENACGDLKDEDPLSSDYRTDNEFTDSGDPLINLDSIKPGDCGKLVLSYQLCGNRGYVWFRTIDKVFEDKYGEPKGENHLADMIEATIWYADSHDHKKYDQSNDTVIKQGSLREVLDYLNDGILLDPDPGDNGGADNSEPENGDSECFELEKVEGDDLYESLESLFDSYDEDGQDGDYLEFDGENDDTVKIWITSLQYQDDDEDEDITGFDWRSNYGISEIEIKGGPPTKTHSFECATTGFVETELNENSGKLFGISNFTFCYCPEVDDPPANGNGEMCTPKNETKFIGLEWCLPTGLDDINLVQQDRATFDFEFYTEQCRHNDDPEPYW